MNDQYAFLLFSIGPVQDFIAAARKTKDLFAGSMMLSHLAGKAIEVVITEGGEMIFPAIEKSPINDNSQIASIPNRILAQVPKEKSVIIAEKIKKGVLREFSQISDAAKKSLGVPNRDNTWDKFWLEQTSKFLECYWVTREIDSTSYGDQYRLIEQFNGKRKLLREFEEMEYDYGKGQPGHKCTLILNLSAVHPSNIDAKTFWRRQSIDKPGEFRKNERLSAIAVMKRYFLDYAHIDGAFPSTTTIAAGNFNRRIIEAYKLDTDLHVPIGRSASKLRNLMSKLHFPEEVSNLPSLEKITNSSLKYFIKIDSDWLYEDMYDKEYLEHEFGIKINNDVQDSLNKARTAHQKLLSSIKDYNKRKDVVPIPAVAKYYSVFFFDGDEMGKWLSGSKENNENSKFTISPKIHGEMSQCLREFSAGNKDTIGTVERIVEGFGENNKPRLGKVIYSGGDDIIAFVSLEDILDVLLEIRQEFGEAMGSVVKNFASVTGSAGIAIAHHQMDLQQVLQEARNAEHYAKETLKRDSFAFALSKRSGEHSIIGTKWFIDELSVIGVLKEFAHLIRDSIISPKFIYDLEEERIGLEVFEQSNSINSDAILGEMKRLFDRHLVKDATKQEERAKAGKYFDERLVIFYRGLLREATKSIQIDALSALHQLIDLLEVAQFIGQGGER